MSASKALTNGSETGSRPGTVQVSAETDPKGTPRKARRHGVDRKGLEDGRRGKESKDRRELKLLGGKEEKQIEESRGYGEGEGANPGKRGGERHRGKE